MIFFVKYGIDESPPFMGAKHFYEIGDAIVKILYLDESGTHSIANPEFDYPVFVLGGVIMEKDYAEREVKARLEAFKMAVFGRRDLILHTADITRNRNGFERLTELAFRKYFYEELNKLLEDLAYKVVACAIDKRDYSALFQQYGFDPYHLSLRILIEMFCHEIGDGSAHGAIIVESRDKKLDRGVKSIWDGLLVTGTKKM